MTARHGELLPLLVAAAAAYVLGTLAALIGAGEWWRSLALWLIGGAAAVAWRPQPRTLLVALALAAIAGGAHARLDDELSRPPSALATLTGVHEIEGVARDDARQFGTLARVDLDVELVDGEALEGGLRLTVPAREPVHGGDRLTAIVEIEPLNDLDDADIADRLRTAGLDATAAFPEQWEREPGNERTLTAALSRWRRTLVGNIERALPEPASGLAAGVLVGERRALPPSIVEDLRRTGTTHLVVVSGQNIAIAAGLLLGLLTLVMSRRRASWITLGLLFPYVIFVGADPPVVRAALMAVGITLGGILGRRTPGWIYLLYAVALMLAWNPGYATDLAFQLSASATAGIIVLAPALRDASLARLQLASTGTRAAVIELASTAAGAAVAVLPVQVAAFERLSLWTIPANILVAPLYEATLLVAVIAAVIGFSPAAAEAFRSVGELVPATFLLVTRFVSAWPSAELSLRAPLLAGVGWVALLAGATWFFARLGRAASPLDPGRPGIGVPVLVGVFAAGLWILVLTPGSSEARVTVFDVGQGLAVLVEDRGSAVLIDVGPPDGALLAALGRRPEGGLDAVVLTHADADHIGGLPELARRRGIGAVFASPATIADAGLEGAQAIDIGDRLSLSARTAVEVLSPPTATALPAHAERNDGSLVLLVTIGARRILVTADIEQPAEAWLADSGLPLRSDALVVPHHGSRSSSSSAFVDAVDPAVAVISVGASNPFGHPAPEVLARYEGALLLRTDEDGDVTFTSDGAMLRVSTERGLD